MLQRLNEADKLNVHFKILKPKGILSYFVFIHKKKKFWLICGNGDLVNFLSISSIKTRQVIGLIHIFTMNTAVDDHSFCLQLYLYLIFNPRGKDM